MTQANGTTTRGPVNTIPRIISRIRPLHVHYWTKKNKKVKSWDPPNSNLDPKELSRKQDVEEKMIID